MSRSEGGALETEYALFDPHEIELRSNNEPGTVREDGYRTTVGLAKERLELDGITTELGDLLFEAMRPSLLAAYARGPLVRKFASQLDATLVFQGGVYDAKAKVQRGLWLDLVALAKDTGVERASAAFQAIYLATLIGPLPDTIPMHLSTAEYTRDRRAGERTHRRVVLMQAARLPEAIRALAAKGAPASSRETGPTRSELLEGLKTRLQFAAEDARDALVKLERELGTREVPARGPLADPELWAIERQMTAGDTNGVVDKIEALDKARGRQPSTAYLRARASLMMGKEEPRIIAERVSALAMSMSAFAELELLAAQAWEQAGEVRRALPYARDLVANPQVDDELRTKAQYIITRAEGPKVSASGPASGRMSAGQMAAAQRASSGQQLAAPRISAAFAGPMPSGSPSSRPRASGSFQGPVSEPPQSPPRGSAPAEDDASAIARVPSARPAAPAFFTTSDHVSQSAMRAQTTSSQPKMSAAQRISQTALPEVEPRRATTHPSIPRAQAAVRSISPPPMSPAPPASPARISPPPGPSFEASARASRSSAPPSIPPPSGVGPSLQELAKSVEQAKASLPPPRASMPPEADTSDSEPPRPYMKGASQPPFRTDLPPRSLSPAAGGVGAGAAPVSSGAPPDSKVVELASTLSMPPGLEGDPAQIDGLPTTIPDARILFTRLSRELGAAYKKQYGIELRTNLRSIEIMQRHLKERFPTGEIETEEEALDVRRHGAFLSEILARVLGAEWVDIALTEVGYWSMVVPPGTLVWPFGRVLRLVAMQHKERDLVSYFLELQTRQMLRR